MKPKLIPASPELLERARQRFERWRHLPKADRRIPEVLWAAAVEAAGRHGVSRTALTLGLSYQALKQRLEAASTSPGPCTREGGATFVELLPPALAGAAECVVELEDHHGAKMRIRLRGTGTPDLATLARAFLGSKA